MSNNQNPHSPKPSLIPFPQSTPLLPLSPEKRSQIPTELKELDNAPIAAVSENNGIPGNAPVKVTPGTETAMITEFNLFADGTVMKYLARPDAADGRSFAPQCLLVDGEGRQYGVIRNAAVAELICNSVNMVHLAKVQLDAEIAARGVVVGGEPNKIITPHVDSAGLN